MGKTYKNIAAAWIRNTKNGEPFLSIKANEDIILKAGEYLNLWHNRRKNSPKHPDYQLLEVAKDADQSPRANRTDEGIITPRRSNDDDFDEIFGKTEDYTR